MGILDCYLTNKKYGGIIMKKIWVYTSLLLMLVLCGSLGALAEEVAEDPFAGMELCIAYDFDFWPEDDNSIGTKNDQNIFFSESPQAGVSVNFTGSKEGAFKDNGKQKGLAFKHESIWEQGQPKNYVAFSLVQRHDLNLYGFDEFPDPKYFTFYVDASKYNKRLEFYPIIYEQDYEEKGEEAGVSCMAINEKATFYLQSKDGKLTSSKAYNNYISLPKGFVGRVYLPLKDYSAIWGTQNVNGKFDGLKVLYYKFSFIDIGNKGDIIYFDELGFLL